MPTLIDAGKRPVQGTGPCHWRMNDRAPRAVTGLLASSATAASAMAG